MIAALAAIPVVVPGVAAAGRLGVAVPLTAAVVVALASLRCRPPHRVAWSLLAPFVALGAVGVGAASGTGGTGGPDGSPLALTLHEVARVASWLAALVALGALVRRAAPDRGALGALEVAVVALAAGTGVWLLVVEPTIAGTGTSIPSTARAAVPPLLGGLALGAAARLAASSAFRHRASNALVAATASLLAADVVVGAHVIRGALVPVRVVDALVVAGSLLVAVAALDAATSAPPRPAGAAIELGAARAAALSVAVLMPLTALLALAVSSSGSTATVIVVAMASVASVVLALARLCSLLDSVRSLTERRGQDRLAAMVEHSSDVVVLLDETGGVRYASPGLGDTLGHRAADWIGRPLVDLMAEEDRAEAWDRFAHLVELGPDSTVRFEVSVVHVDGRRRRVEASLANLVGGDAVDGVVATLRDVTEERARERTLSHRAFHDELTGLANRASFLERVGDALRAVRPDADPVVVLFVDLDDFKGVNDTMGHEAGDQLLRAIAHQVRSVSGAGDTPARLGGDEFALLLEEAGGVDRALDVAERLLDGLREPVRVGEVDLAVLASVGVAVAAPGTGTAELLRDADTAMYEAKRGGKGRIEVYDPAMRLGPTTQLAERDELAAALDRGQLRLVLQPIIDLRTGEVAGAEALVRWHHPVRGEVPPGEFIPLAERSGSIKEIGAWVLAEAMGEAARWPARSALTVNVNVSVVQLRAPGFVDQVRAALATTGLDPRRVVLEINESVLVDQIEAGAEVLAGLRDLGVGLAIDNFGTSWCSLSCLHRFPVDVIKIDRAVVARDDGFAELLVAMIARLGARSVAEGLERAEQVGGVRALGFDQGQGLVLSGPLELDVVRERFGVVGTARRAEPGARDGEESGASLVGTV